MHSRWPGVSSFPALAAPVRKSCDSRVLELQCGRRCREKSGSSAMPFGPKAAESASFGIAVDGQLDLAKPENGALAGVNPGTRDEEGPKAARARWQTKRSRDAVHVDFPSLSAGPPDEIPSPTLPCTRRRSVRHACRQVHEIAIAKSSIVRTGPTQQAHATQQRDNDVRERRRFDQFPLPQKSQRDIELYAKGTTRQTAVLRIRSRFLQRPALRLGRHRRPGIQPFGRPDSERFALGTEAHSGCHVPRTDQGVLYPDRISEQNPVNRWRGRRVGRSRTDHVKRNPPGSRPRTIGPGSPLEHGRIGIPVEDPEGPAPDASEHWSRGLDGPGVKKHAPRDNLDTAKTIQKRLFELPGVQFQLRHGLAPRRFVFLSKDCGQSLDESCRPNCSHGRHVLPSYPNDPTANDIPSIGIRELPLSPGGEFPISSSAGHRPSGPCRHALYRGYAQDRSGGWIRRTQSAT